MTSASPFPKTIVPKFSTPQSFAAASVPHERSGVQAQTNEPTLVDRIFNQSNEPAPVTDADRDYASQLASIDELRDRALTTGDATLLQRADRLEAELKANTRTGFSLFGN